MVRYAADMMLESGSPVTNALLSGISILDDLGAWTWNLRWVSLAWFVVFGALRKGLGKSRGIDWYTLIHAILTGVGGVVCAYLSFGAAEELTGVPEPFGTAICGGPLTSLHRVLPTAALGFSIFDLMDGMSMGVDFLGHGVAMLAFSLYMLETNRNEVYAVMLTLEFSSIFLNFVRADFMTPPQQLINMIVFVITFFLARIVFGPYSWYIHCKYLYEQTEALSCQPSGFRHVIFITGLFFNILNCFWFYKIIKKLQRKLNGKEGIKASNGYQNGNEHNDKLTIRSGASPVRSSPGKSTKETD